MALLARKICQRFSGESFELIMTVKGSGFGIARRKEKPGRKFSMTMGKVAISPSFYCRSRALFRLGICSIFFLNVSHNHRIFIFLSRLRSSGKLIL